MQPPLQLSKSSDERLQQDIPLGACNKKGRPIYIITSQSTRPGISSVQIITSSTRRVISIVMRIEDIEKV
jgi:hypothetical protein